MSDIYAMQRANGDWFSFEDDSRLRLPLFNSSHDALMARLHNFEMMLFQPVMLNVPLLAKMLAGASSVLEFCLVADPFERLNRAVRVETEQLASLISAPHERSAAEFKKLSNERAGYGKRQINTD